MNNEFKTLTNLDVFKMYKRAIKASQQSIDREYLLQRKVALRKECVRRGIL